MPSYPRPSSPAAQDGGARALKGLLAGDGTVLDEVLRELSPEETMDLHDAAMLLVDSIRFHAKTIQ